MDREIFGSTFLVDQTWYFRFATGGGALVPLTCGSGADQTKLLNGAAVRIVGRLVQDHRGCTTEAYASAFEIIGSRA